MFVYNLIISDIVNSVVKAIIRPFVILLLTLATPSVLADNTLNDHIITFKKPWVRALPPSVMSTAAYVEIYNNSDQNDTLVNVSSPLIHMMSLHQTKEANGILSMVEADNTTIPANGKLVLQPGGYHLMLMGLKKPLTEGDSITINFQFEKSGLVKIDFPVRKK